jgi:hypothetical protein
LPSSRRIRRWRHPVAGWVSRYFDPVDGPPHTRMSIYGADGRIACVVALDDESTNGLATFLESLGVGEATAAPRRVRDRLASWRGAR